MAVLCAGYPVAAVAAPGDTFTISGNGRANVVEPVDIQPVADLRFGRIVQPATAGTLTIGVDGSETSTGGVTAAMNTPQGPNGRGPAAFAVFGDANRRFLVFHSNSITLTSGTSFMTVSNLDANAGPPGFSNLDANGYYALFIGGELAVAANQPAGVYTGTFEIRVQYN